MTITELVEKNHAAMVEKGFHQEEKNIGEVLMLIVSELGEALEAHRKNNFFDSAGLHKELREYADGSKEHDDSVFFRHFVKDTFQDEIADAVLRLTDLCGLLGIDLETHIRAKMRYNKSREPLHGKAY